MMYFSRLTLRKPDDSIHLMMMGDKYELHQQVWSLFPYSDCGRDFIYRMVGDRGAPSIFVVSHREPCDVDGIWNVESKLYDPSIEEGQAFRFDLRANPIISRRDEKGRQHRHDVVMDLKSSRKASKEADLPEAVLLNEAVGAWVRRKGEANGFSLMDMTLSFERYTQHRLRKPNGSMVSFSTVDIKGVLNITDEELFKEALFKGVGPAKGFGCGMLMIRRA